MRSLRRSGDSAQSPTAVISLAPPLLLLAAAGIWFVRPVAGPWPLLLVGMGLALSMWVLHKPWLWTPFDPPLLLFLASAALGAAVANAQGLPWPKFWEVMSSLVVFRALLMLPSQVQVRRGVTFSPPAWLFGLLPALIAVLFILTNDWQLWGGKMVGLDEVGRWLSRWQVSLPGFMWIRSSSGAWAFHPNVAGGLIAALIPLQWAALCSSRSRSGRGLLAGAILVSLVGLALTGSRGAWLALALAGGVWLAWELSKRWPARLGPPARRGLWLGLAAAVALLGIFLLLRVCSADCLAGAAGRLELYRHALALALDTPFTGLGLGGDRFQMAYSSYVLLLHVGFLPHSHNLLLQVLLEQGILGVLALVWIAALVVTRRGPFGLWQAAARASFAAIIIHGMVDIPFYTGRGLHLLLIPLAVMSSPAMRPRPPDGVLPSVRPATARSTSSWLVPALLLIGLLLMLLPSSQAALQANLGALDQTRAELSRYTWPEWPIQDELRRSSEIDLEPAIARYRAALAANPANAAANRRLAQIELARGDYQAARAHLETAYATAPSNRATRQLLGEMYAIDGEMERAAEMLSTVDTSLNQLDLRVFWYTHIGEQEKAERLKQLAGD